MRKWLFPFALMWVVTCSAIIGVEYNDYRRASARVQETQLQYEIQRAELQIPPYHLLPALKFARAGHIDAAGDEDLLKKYLEVFSYDGTPYIVGASVEAQLKWVKVYDELIYWLERDMKSK